MSLPPAGTKDFQSVRFQGKIGVAILSFSLTETKTLCIRRAFNFDFDIVRPSTASKNFSPRDL